MSEALKRHHPMHDAEIILQKIGIRHAPIQAFGEDDKIAGLDGRFVCAFDPSGPYYILGCDNDNVRNSHNREKIQVLFWQCPEQIASIAEAIGWDVEKVEILPVTGPESEKFDPVTSAIFAMKPERVPQLQNSVAA